MSHEALFVGLDLGTSGARAVVIDAAGQIKAQAKALMADFGSDPRDPAIWWRAAKHALGAAISGVDATRISALSVDGTSGTMVAVDTQGRPLAPGLMYNDACTEAAILDAISRHAPATSAALGASSALARALHLQNLRPHRILHQADWIAWHLSGVMISDANNALKTGYDPVAARWPDWISDTGMRMDLLPEVVEPSLAVAAVTTEAARTFGLSPDCVVVAGTTDGCASFLATGADTVGDGVTALGTTLTVKILSDRPIFAPQYGIYSHRILGQWLAGGASNSGGAALLAHFTADEMTALTPTLNPDQPLDLNYYPLPRKGERFPINDPELSPRLSPKPETRAQFLQAMFEGIAAIEALAYRRLAELGAPALTRLRSVGGGAHNPAWSAIRARALQVPFHLPRSDEAAYGAALLAQRGAE